MCPWICRNIFLIIVFYNVLFSSCVNLDHFLIITIDKVFNDMSIHHDILHFPFYSYIPKKMGIFSYDWAGGGGCEWMRPLLAACWPIPTYNDKSAENNSRSSQRLSQAVVPEVTIVSIPGIYFSQFSRSPFKLNSSVMYRRKFMRL